MDSGRGPTVREHEAGAAAGPGTTIGAVAAAHLAAASSPGRALGDLADPDVEDGTGSDCDHSPDATALPTRAYCCCSVATADVEASVGDSGRDSEVQDLAGIGIRARDCGAAVDATGRQGRCGWCRRS